MTPQSPSLDVHGLFTIALGLVPPWRVVDLRFDAEEKRLDMQVDFQPGATFACPKCGEACKVHDAEAKTWRHMNFFQHVTYITARTPRTDCQKDGVLRIDVPWARKGSNFTLLFEALVIELARNGMTVKAISRIVGENDTLLWRMLEHYVDKARAGEDYSRVKSVGVDETSQKKGHVYLTLFADAEASKVLFVTEGKDHETVEKFREDLIAHGGDAASITEFSLDMSKAFIKGIKESFPNAELTFDRYHVISLLNRAVDKVRRDEQKTRPELKKTRYDWLRNEESMGETQRERFDDLRKSDLRTAKAYAIKTMFQDLYDQPPEEALGWFKRWYFWATHSRIPQIISVAQTLKASYEGIMRWFESGLTNGFMEGINSLVQSAKARARGFQSARKMKVVIYLLLSKLNFQLPSILPVHSA